jgi:naphthoate synthase
VSNRERPLGTLCNRPGVQRILRGTDLRYALTRLLQVLGPMTVSDLCAQLADWNFTVEGRPTKAVSDALRWEIGRGRVHRSGRGLYAPGHTPSGTAYRIVRRVESLRCEAEALRSDEESLRSEPESLRGGVNHPRTFETVSQNPFNPELWQPVEGFQDLTDITYHRHMAGGAPQPTVRVAFNRPDVRNAFRPHTVDELYRALDHARMSPDVGVVLLTGNGPSPKDGGWAFCSGGDQRIRGRTGYQYASGDTADTVDAARAGRLHILEVQRLIRFMPKPVICLVSGWAAGGGHSLHVVCDLTLASREHARFKQTDADVGSFDGGYGSAYLARQVGQKFAREIFFLGEDYTAEQMHAMGAVNRVVDHADLETVGLQWAEKINGKSPQAQRMLKFAFNLLDDGLVGQQLFAGEATRLAYMTDEAVEGRDAFLEKRSPDWTPFPRYF